DTTNDVSILLGNGNGTFQPAVNYPAGSTAISVAINDFDGDGKPDLAVSDNGSNNMSILLGNGNGTFQAPVNYAAGTGPRTVRVGDFNADGKPDMAVVDFYSNTVSFLLNISGCGTPTATPTP